jgi:hypothetical protein
MDEINIHGLTEYQCTLLDIMWSIDTYEEYLEWVEYLSEDDRNQVELLQRLLIIEALDKDWEAKKKFPEANKALKKFMLPSTK